MIDTPEKQSDTAQPESPAYSARRIWWIVGGTITGAMLLFVMAVAGVWIWTASSPQDSYTLDEEYAGPVTSAEVEVEVGDIVLEGAAGTTLELNTHAEWRGSEPDTAEGVSGGVFSAEADCDSGFALWGGLDDCRVDYTVGLPAGTAADVSTDIGHIRLDGIDGDVKAEASVGDVEGVDRAPPASRPRPASATSGSSSSRSSATSSSPPAPATSSSRSPTTAPRTRSSPTWAWVSRTSTSRPTPTRRPTGSSR